MSQVAAAAATVEGGVVESREWYMSAYAPKGVPNSDHLKLRTVTVSVESDSLPEQHVAFQLLWISIDPYLRSGMTGLKDGLSFPPFPINQALTAFSIGRVISSRKEDEQFGEGDIVIHPFAPVSEYSVVSTAYLRKIDPASGIPFPVYLSSLGVPGFAGWVGIELIAKPKAGSNVFISAAAGAVGMFAGQLAKLRGCRVIGSTGSDEKVNLLKEEFGYDDAFNYHVETDFDAALSKYFPDGIDVYFENVGGKMLEGVLNHVNKGAVIPLCGMISDYNKVWTEREGVRNLLNIIGKEVKLEGFITGSRFDRFGDFLQDMEPHIKEGKIQSKHKAYHGIETFLEAFASMFSSSNIGKVVLQVSD